MGKKLLILISLAVFFTSFGYALSRIIPKGVDPITKAVCWANRDRGQEKFVPPERWEKFGERWKDFDWYQSCIDNIEVNTP